MSSEPSPREIIEYWKQIVAVQMHFNDLCIRTRWLGLTVTTTILGAGLLTFRITEPHLNFTSDFISFKIHISIFIFALSHFIIGGIFIIDKMYYSKLLISAVLYGEKFENNSEVFAKINSWRIGSNQSNHNGRAAASCEKCR